MILATLIEELRALFGRNAQARIALWFDEKRELERLLAAFEKHLASHVTPPFALLRYDEKAGHGPLWLKHEIHWASRSLPPKEREAPRRSPPRRVPSRSSRAATGAPPSPSHA